MKNLASEWARLWAVSLADAGLSQLFLSPGSRSTPFAWAMVAEPRVEVTVVMDERSAGFAALGWGKLTGRPAAVLCTSGSAPAHYLPSILEAGYSAAPLLVLTADRPPELMGVAAPQTVNQTQLYGDAVRGFFDPGVPDPHSLHSLRRTAAQCVALCQGPDAGAVHVNLGVRKPFDPAQPTTEAEKTLTANVNRTLSQPITVAPQPTRHVPDDALQKAANSLAESKRGLLIVGPLPLGAVSQQVIADIAASAQVDVYLETTSGLRRAAKQDPLPRYVRNWDVLARAGAFAGSERPDYILQVGLTPTSKGYADLISHGAPIPRDVLCHHSWVDPFNSARQILQGDLEPALQELRSALAREEGTENANETLQKLDQSATEFRDRTRERFAEPGAIAAIASLIPEDSVLVLGNSLPVREIDTFSDGLAAKVSVVSQRGTSGIDGIISGAVGVARACKKTVTVLLGDVSLHHDISGLLLAAGLNTPFVIAVINNEGGRIFDQLPLASNATVAEMAPWLTPHDTDFRHAAALYQLDYREVSDPQEAGSALQAALAKRGATLVEFKVPPSSARDAMEQLLEQVRETIGAVSSP
ncbi:MAG: 2-succinyl-5-enolpyruvyl-6-hydroxy-3-cyclohexene-1-carboxylic-acid synthase [Polyangiaceae bacterium]|nr:2-succinyl-5-enolpyruvyl-6-hydroxy-3-cyclohexene-1-carboxylic-acid synthase [Polyangiaceae bacterium]